MPLVNFNGLIATGDEPLVSSDNPAFCYGEGLIETMLWRKNAVRFFDRHMQRLREGLRQLKMPSIAEKTVIHEICRTVVANQDPGSGIVRCQFFAGESGAALHFLISYKPLAATAPDALRIGITRSVVKSSDEVSRLKTSSRLIYKLAAREASEKGWDDALLLNPQGRVAESTIANVFWIKDNRLYTPPLNEGPVAGVMRQHLLDAGSIAGIPVQEKALDIAALSEADELFLCNAVRGIRPVGFVGNKTYPSTLTHKIADVINLL